MTLHRGDVILADYTHAAAGSSFRPVLVVQADFYNQRIRNCVVAQVTSTIRRSTDPAHFFIDTSSVDGLQSGLLRDSVVSCINLSTIDAQRVKRVIGRLSPSMMAQVDACLKTALGLP